MNTKKCKKGFSLIEVMIALLVLALGILGISKLQGTLIKNASDANARVTAVHLAQRKIDDLRSYINLTTVSADIPDVWTAGLSPNLLSYQHIDDNTGGAATGVDPAGLTAGIVTTSPYVFQLMWEVDDYWYDPANPLLPATTTPPVPAPVVSDFKKVTVNVSWIDESGDNQSVSLETFIDAYAPQLTSLSDNNISAGGQGPSSNYTPLPAPDVVPVSIKADDSKFKETSVPEPEVTRQDYATIVEFETVTYNNADLALRREDIVTAACSCAANTSIADVTHTYGYLTWDAKNEQFTDATYDVVNNNNDIEEFAGADSINECEICCRDGQYETTEPDGVIPQSQPFGLLGDLGAGVPDKVCRLKRIDGIYRVIKPWKLIAFNVIPSSYFDPEQTDNFDANITTYSNYVERTVRAALSSIDEETDIAVTDYTVDNSFSESAAVADYVDAGYNSTRVSSSDGLGDHTLIRQGTAATDSRPLQARAVFLDIPPDGYLTNSAGPDYSNADVPLERVPFYETNVTSLVGWVPDEDQIIFDDSSPSGVYYTAEHDEALQGGSVRQACQESVLANPSAPRNCVSNQELTNKSFGDFQRGDFYPYVEGDTAVEARMHTGVDGLVDYTINSNPVSAASLAIGTINP